MTDVTPSSPPRRLGPVTLIVILAALAILLALGTWQVKRLYWKQDLLAKIETRMVAAPAGLEEIIALKQSGEDIEYRRVSLTGQFRHAAEQFFFSTLNGRTGYFVYTPFETEAGQVIFVNRGFVEVDFKDPATRSQGQVAGTVSVVGLARDRGWIKNLPGWCLTMISQRTFFTGRISTPWRSMPGLTRSRSNSFPSLLMLMRARTLVAGRLAASPRSICPTAICNMPSPGTVWLWRFWVSPVLSGGVAAAANRAVGVDPLALTAPGATLSKGPQ